VASPTLQCNSDRVSALSHGQKNPPRAFLVGSISLSKPSGGGVDGLLNANRRHSSPRILITTRGHRARTGHPGQRSGPLQPVFVITVKCAAPMHTSGSCCSIHPCPTRLSISGSILPRLIPIQARPLVYFHPRGSGPHQHIMQNRLAPPQPRGNGSAHTPTRIDPGSSTRSFRAPFPDSSTRALAVLQPKRPMRPS
jgi:hypothetical protein